MIVTDTNDNSPSFNLASHSATLPEDAPVNTVVLKMHATDPDLGKYLPAIRETHSEIIFPYEIFASEFDVNESLQSHFNNRHQSKSALQLCGLRRWSFYH